MLIIPLNKNFHSFGGVCSFFNSFIRPSVCFTLGLVSFEVHISLIFFCMKYWSFSLSPKTRKQDYFPHARPEVDRIMSKISKGTWTYKALAFEPNIEYVGVFVLEISPDTNTKTMTIFRMWDLRFTEFVRKYQKVHLHAKRFHLNPSFSLCLFVLKVSPKQ